MKSYFSVTLLTVLSLVFFQGCSESNFSAIDSAQKLSTLENHSGLGSDDLSSENSDNGLSTQAPDSGNQPQQNQIGMGGIMGMGGLIMPMGQNDSGVGPIPPKQNDAGTSGTPNRPVVTVDRNPTNNQFDSGKDPITNPTLGRFNVIRWCRGRDQGATLKEAKDIVIIVRDLTKKEIQCEARGANLLNQIMTTGQIDIPNCNFSNIGNNQLSVEVKNENGQSLSDGTENSITSNAFDTKNRSITSDDGRAKFTAVALHLLMDKNINKTAAENCDAYNSSPLVVDMRSQRELHSLFELTEPSVGVDFDILGLNSIPSAYTEKRISWFKDPRIMPIVLPRNGSVDGINELFGDNTLGPDNEFADNGFAALAKYDGLNLRTKARGKADGYINKKDEIYFKLKVWYDRNLNGIAESKELTSLQNAGIEIIDLKFDPDFYSRDQFGNEIKYKSVVKLKNGELKPVFDIWFTVNNLIQK